MIKCWRLESICSRLLLSTRFSLSCADRFFRSSCTPVLRSPRDAIACANGPHLEVERRRLKLSLVWNAYRSKQVTFVTISSGHDKREILSLSAPDRIRIFSLSGPDQRYTSSGQDQILILSGPDQVRTLSGTEGYGTSTKNGPPSVSHAGRLQTCCQQFAGTDSQ